MQELEAPTLHEARPILSGTLDPATETDLYRFEAAAGDRVFFDIQARSGAPTARRRSLYPFVSGVFDRDFNNPASNAGPRTLAATGTYTLLLDGRFFEIV